MQTVSRDQLKKIRPYALGAIPFIVLFAYELAVILPHRPATSDLVHGYTIAAGNAHKMVYISTVDCVLIFGTFACAFAVIATGFWRTGLFQRLLQR